MAGVSTIMGPWQRPEFYNTGRTAWGIMPSPTNLDVTFPQDTKMAELFDGWVPVSGWLEVIERETKPGGSFLLVTVPTGTRKRQMVTFITKVGEETKLSLPQKKGGKKK